MQLAVCQCLVVPGPSFLSPFFRSLIIGKYYVVTIFHFSQTQPAPTMLAYWVCFISSFQMGKLRWGRKSGFHKITEPTTVETEQQLSCSWSEWQNPVQNSIPPLSVGTMPYTGVDLLLLWVWAFSTLHASWW